MLYLERRDYGLGQDFHEEVRKTEREIEESPDSGRLLENGTMRRRVARFPYALIFREEEEQIVIYAVAAFSREPGYWIERLP